jgi:hypothetical protein
MTATDTVLTQQWSKPELFPQLMLDFLLRYRTPQTGLKD